MLNTLKTVFGFIGQAIEKNTWISFSGSEPEKVFNYVALSDRLATSGQPNEKQLAMISAAGYTTVINLAPTSRLENAVIEERSILESLGVSYIHIPVDFENPTEEDYTRFAQEMVANADARLWVHCAANMRVSAFMYRYRISELGLDESVARSDLTRIWEPFGAWKKFIGWE